jgi:hypothetical protein
VNHGTMVRVRRALQAITTCVCLAAPFGCTVISGWSDLQGGERPPAPSGADAASRDARAADGGGQPPSQDAAPTVITGIHCGAERCADGEICCWNAGALACSSTTGCDDIVLACTTRSDCSPGQECCLDETFVAAQCRPACGGGAGTSAPLCSPREPADCATGTSCQVKRELPGLSECR